MDFYFELHNNKTYLGWQTTLVGWPTAGISNGTACSI